MIRYVGVDGGNSKTHVAVADGAGRVRAAVQGPGSSPDKLGPIRAVELIRRLVDECLARVGGEPIDERLVVAAMLAGLDTPEDLPPVRAALQEQLSHAHIHVDNDTMALLLAGTAGAPGVAVVCGAGINAVGWDGESSRAGFLSLGHLSGDWGGGLSLGRDILWHVARADDGRGASTALTPITLRCFQVHSVRELILALHRGIIPQERLLELVPRLFDVADEGDEVARGMVARLAEEVSTMAVLAAKRSGLSDSEIPVVLGGSVLTSGHESLLAPIRRTLAAQLPRTRPVVLQRRPVLGALIAAHRIAHEQDKAKEFADNVARSMPAELEMAGDNALAREPGTRIA